MSRFARSFAYAVVAAAVSGGRTACDLFDSAAEDSGSYNGARFVRSAMISRSIRKLS